MDPQSASMSGGFLKRNKFNFAGVHIEKPFFVVKIGYTVFAVAILKWEAEIVFI